MTSTTKADATLLALGEALELAVASERAMLAALPTMPDVQIDNRVVDAVCGPASAICRMIEGITPTTAEGWAVRSRAWRFMQGGHDLVKAAA